MDGRSRYNKIEKVKDLIKGSGKIQFNQLKQIIWQEIGTNEKLVSEVVHIMEAGGFISETDHMVYKIYE